MDSGSGSGGAAIEGPVTGGLGTPWVSATSFDLSAAGYTEEEFFVSGTARAFANVGELGPDGAWTVTPAGSAAYKTRIVVFRPTDATRFNGSVIVEWLNVSGGLDAAPDWTSAHTELMRRGYAWVGVSAQRVGIEGGGSLLPIPGLPDTSLKGFDPGRYSSLTHPGDSFSYDIFTQAGRLLRTKGTIDPLGGLKPKRVIAAGESQSAFRLVTYVNAVDPLARVYDGFLIHSRGGGGAALSEVPEPAIAVPSMAPIRDDVRVPVLTFQTETDLMTLGYLSNRQPDSDKFRLWEVPGTAHADTYTLKVGATDQGDDPSVADIVITSAPIPGIIECDVPINSGPQHFVLNAAIAALNDWVTDSSKLPPKALRLETAGAPAAYVLDDNGNVKGGIRTPYVDAPTAALSGLGQSGTGFCLIFGTTVPFDAAKLASLYKTHAAYVDAVNQATDAAVASGFILAPDAALIKAAAKASTIGN
jgi:hypothetical protein